MQEMAKAQTQTQSDRQQLESRIMDIAQAFARQVIEAINSATMEELQTMQEKGTPVAARVPRYAHGPVKRRSWPTCIEPNCKGRYYPASGTARLCYKHFIASGGRHPSRRK